jgi:hypothetical protein
VRGGSTAGRVAIIGLIVVLLVALAGLGAWAAIIRPQLHQQLDDALRAQLNGIVTTVNQQPVVPTTTVNITASQVTQTLQTQLPSSLPIQDLRVSFGGGRVSVAFTTGGFAGAVSTALTVHNGRLVASATEVDGPLALVESGGDMEQALNAALGKLRTDVTVKQITLDKDTMSVAVKGNI